MNASFDFVGSNDKPALIAFSTPDWLDTAKTALQELGYKVHTAATHSDFLLRFTQAQYQVVLVEELFGANSIDENLTLTKGIGYFYIADYTTSLPLKKWAVEKGFIDGCQIDDTNTDQEIWSAPQGRDDISKR